jgi:hypothetical protein
MPSPTPIGSGVIGSTRISLFEEEIIKNELGCQPRNILKILSFPNEK